MNSSPSETPAPPPESETLLQSRAETLSEEALALLAGSAPLYALLRRQYAQTTQSDYFRVQLRAHAVKHGLNWQAIDGDDAHWQDGSNLAYVCVDHPSATVSFGPRGGISTSERLAGHGVSAYLFAQTILWAKARYPDYSVKGGLLHLADSASEEERLRRNSFYASQGFDFEWFDPEQRTGRYYKKRVDQLLGVWDSGTIRDISCEHLLDSLAQQDGKRAELEEQLARLASHKEHLASRYERERLLNLILTGVTCFVLTMGLMAALGV